MQLMQVVAIDDRKLAKELTLTHARVQGEITPDEVVIERLALAGVHVLGHAGSFQRFALLLERLWC